MLQEAARLQISLRHGLDGTVPNYHYEALGRDRRDEAIKEVRDVFRAEIPDFDEETFDLVLDDWEATVQRWEYYAERPLNEITAEITRFLEANPVPSANQDKDEDDSEGELETEDDMSADSSSEAPLGAKEEPRQPPPAPAYVPPPGSSGYNPPDRLTL